MERETEYTERMSVLLMTMLNKLNIPLDSHEGRYLFYKTICLIEHGDGNVYSAFSKAFGILVAGLDHEKKLPRQELTQRRDPSYESDYKFLDFPKEYFEKTKTVLDPAIQSSRLILEIYTGTLPNNTKPAWYHLIGNSPGNGNSRGDIWLGTNINLLMSVEVVERTILLKTADINPSRDWQIIRRSPTVE